MGASELSPFKRGVDLYGVGAGASALVCGRSRAHVELERVVAEFTGRERALLFCSGYMANLALGTSGLVGAADLVIGDRLNHASLNDGGRFPGARLRRYPHCDHEAAAKFLGTDTRRKLVLTDGVFSMDGDVAPVSQLAVACRQVGALLAVDDAHGLGVLGETGGGMLQVTGLGQNSVPLLVGTFGKAVGTAGAFIAGPDAVSEFLCQRARTHMYTTAPPPALAYATRLAIEYIATESEPRARLAGLIACFHSGATELGLPAPAATSRLRITITAAHTRQDLDRLLQQLACLLRPERRE